MVERIFFTEIKVYTPASFKSWQSKREEAIALRDEFRGDFI
jgi:hypothetical protein